VGSFCEIEGTATTRMQISAKVRMGFAPSAASDYLSSERMA
jgi:hypothetical protein